MTPEYKHTDITHSRLLSQPCHDLLTALVSTLKYVAFTYGTSEQTFALVLLSKQRFGCEHISVNSICLLYTSTFNNSLLLLVVSPTYVGLKFFKRFLILSQHIKVLKRWVLLLFWILIVVLASFLKSSPGCVTVG